MNEVMGHAAALSGHAEDMSELLDESPARLALATDAVRASGDTLYEDKPRALAGVLTYGLTDDAHLDMAAPYLGALRDLVSYHVRVWRFWRLGVACWTIRMKDSLTTT